MFRLLKSTPGIVESHEDVFVARCKQLRSWARALAGDDLAQAEDLVQDAYIQFTVLRPDLKTITNLDGYLYEVLRNLHLSHIRRATRNHLQQLSIMEYDSAETGLLKIDPRDQLKARDELRAICRYACRRRETSKTGSILILRFFHGYYPSEIVKILKSTRQVVDFRLAIARREARLSLDSPQALSFVGKADASSSIQGQSIHRPSADIDEILSELRGLIFDSRSGACLPLSELKKLYGEARGTPGIKATPLDCQSLAHIVSCHACLDLVNGVLDLPLLSDRYPADTLRQDTRTKDEGRRKGGGGPGDGSTGGTPGVDHSVRRYRRQARQTFEHRPKELHISVNGLVLGSRQINAEVNDLTLDISLAEAISFIEAFSEQEFRLALFKVAAPPPIGPLEQSTHVELSDSRTLDLLLTFSSPWPTLRAVYRDPLMQSAPVAEAELEQDDLPPASLPAQQQTAPVAGYLKGLKLAAAETWRQFFDWSFWLRPGAVTTLVALILIAALAIFYRHVPTAPLSATDVLQRAAASEEVIANNRDQVTHRTLRLEQKSSAGQLISTRRVEVWHSAVNGVTARRLYDENGSLVAGDWRRADGVQTIYHHGQRPQLQLAPDKRGPTPVSFENVWQLDLAAKNFSSLIGRTQSSSAQEANDAYVINYASDSGATSSGLIKATLVLGRSDLHAKEQTLVVRQGDEIREFRFVETSFERREADSVAPAVFEPDASLLASVESGARSPKPETHTSASGPSTPFLATPELELQVLKQLNQANAFYGEQISLSRTPEGRLQVQGIVETEKRKSDILNALSSVRHNPALQIQVETVAEASERQSRQRSSLASGTTEIANVEVEAKSAVPAAPELRAYLSQQKGLSGEPLEEEMRRFEARVMGHTRQARRHALALKQIAEGFSADDLRALDPAARNQWRAMISEHARSIEQELEALRRELQPLFPSVATSDGDGATAVATE